MKTFLTAVAVTLLMSTGLAYADGPACITMEGTVIALQNDLRDSGLDPAIKSVVPLPAPEGKVFIAKLLEEVGSHPDPEKQAKLTGEDVGVVFFFPHDERSLIRIVLVDTLAGCQISSINVPLVMLNELLDKVATDAKKSSV